MKLTRRLLLSAAVIVALLVALVVLVALRRAGNTARSEEARHAATIARVVAAEWTAGADPGELARRVAAETGMAITLLDREGVLVADGTRGSNEMSAVPTIFPALPEIVEARERGEGVDWQSTGTSTALRVAVRLPAGYVRVVTSAETLENAMERARRDVYMSGLAVLVLAILLSWWIGVLARKPLYELRDVTRALASGDLGRRPALVAPGAVGDLGSSIYRLAEQMTGRLDALKAEEALLRATMESLNEGIIALDERGQVVRINATARRLLGSTDPTPFPSERLPRDRALREALAAALAGTSTDGLQVSVLGYTLTITARPLAGGGAVLAAYDLTRLRQLETVRRDFVANVSHELKTPLTIVSGFAETLREENVPDQVRREFASSISRNALRMQRIVDDLLDLSRIESGGWVPRPVRTSVAAAAAEAFTNVSATAEESGTSLETDIGTDAATVMADPTALRQLLSNLVENAVRYTPSGKVTVFTRREGNGVNLGVRDSGSGIPYEHLPRIFERFYRADAGRSREAGGTGLGLAIVRHLVEAHGGRVWAESTPGRGTTITAHFPDLDATLPPPAAPTSSASVSA
ncbi:MAG TPA: ATP-binding protein [Gemmatimonadales bacterium]|nr:ATP-binding protein [Gemmatimonadales bacterium]